VTSYDYFPLIGLSSLTDINGYTTTYQYDSFSHLKSIKDPLNYFLKGFYYHYANQTALTGWGLTPTNTMNYVISRTAREAQSALLSNHTDSTTTQIEYFDGLSRSLQSQIWQAAPDKTKDLITNTNVYDTYGRAYKKILSTPSNGNLGAYKSTALSLANTFYADTASYSQTVFEPSPLNRPKKQYGAGQAWRAADKYLLYEYLLAGNGITRFDIQLDSSVNCSNTYPSSSLLNECVSSERAIQTYELKDKQGRVTHKYQLLEPNTFNFAITAYVYDDYTGHLMYMIPPEAYKKLGVGLITSFTEKSDVFKELIFGYHYDSKGRLIEKHIPGAGWTRYVYDKNDRVVLENDDKDAAASTNYYKFTLYDALGRSIMSGTINNIAAFSRTQLQSDFDAVTTPYEERGTGLLGYTNRSFPSGYQPIDANVKSVSYYDDYAWQTDTTIYGFKSAYAYHTRGLTKGLVTGTLTRNLETNTWQKNVAYYDYKGRVIQDFHLTNRGNIIRKDYQYRFNGERLKTRITKGTSVKILTYEYDHVGRKTKFKHSLNGE
jgi:YD repeat-containing protein